MTKPAPQFRQIAGPLDDISDDALGKLGDELGVPSLVLSRKAPLPDAAGPSPAPETSPPNPVRVTVKAVSKGPRPTVPVSVEERGTPSLEKISLELPDYLAKAMRMRVAEEGTTLRYLVMQGLQAIGFNIDTCDFVTDGRSFRSKTR